MLLDYHVGGQFGWSDMYYFKTIPDGVNWSPTVAIYGDMGNSNDVSMADLQSEAQMGTIDSILHIGFDKLQNLSIQL